MLQYVTCRHVLHLTELHVSHGVDHDGAGGVDVDGSNYDDDHSAGTAKESRLSTGQRRS